jgi:Domain of unknown function (DUF2382)
MASSQLKDSHRNDNEESLDTNDIQKNELIPPISLLEERLVVRLDRHKVGEVIIRKEIETQIIEVPIRREKLIVEQIAPEYKQIAIIDLGTNSASLVKINEEASSKYSEPIVKGEFESVRLASQFLEAIAQLPDVGSTSIKIEIKAEDSLMQKNYQELLEDFLNQWQ